MQQLHTLWSRNTDITGHTGEVTIRSTETFDQAHLDWVSTAHKDNGDRFGCRLCCKCRGDAESNDHCHVAASQFGRQRRQPVILTLGPTPFDAYVLTFDKADGPQSFQESGIFARNCTKDALSRTPIVHWGSRARVFLTNAGPPPRNVTKSRRLIRSPPP